MALLTIDPGKRDIKKISGNIFTLAIAGALGLAAYVWLLPFLIALVWGTVEMVVGVIVGVILLGMLISKKFWMFWNLLGQSILQFAIGWLIEMNPFNILNYRIEKSEEDAEKLLDYNKKLSGKAAEIQDKLASNDLDLRNALAKKTLLERKLQTNPNDQNSINNLQEVIGDINSSKDYIDGIKPTFNDLQKLVIFTDKAYQTATLNLRIAKKDLVKKRDLYETVTTASATIGKAWKALMGDKDVNNAADSAIEFLKKDIGQKIGNIRTGIKVTGQFLDGQDLENAGKLQATLKQLEGVDLSHTDYSTTVDQAGSMELGNLTPTNKYITLLDSTKKP